MTSFQIRFWIFNNIDLQFLFVQPTSPTDILQSEKTYIQKYCTAKNKTKYKNVLVNKFIFKNSTSTGDFM